MKFVVHMRPAVLLPPEYTHKEQKSVSLKTKPKKEREIHFFLLTIVLISDSLINKIV